MTKDEHLNLVLKKKELWLKGNNFFSEASRLNKDLDVYINSTKERIKYLNNEGKKYLDEMQEIAQQMDKLEIQ